MEIDDKMKIQVFVQELDQIRSNGSYPNPRLETIEMYLLKKIEQLLQTEVNT